MIHEILGFIINHLFICSLDAKKFLFTAKKQRLNPVII
jgi:hypothetical protein